MGAPRHLLRLPLLRQVLLVLVEVLEAELLGDRALAGLGLVLAVLGAGLGGLLARRIGVFCAFKSDVQLLLLRGCLGSLRSHAKGFLRALGQLGGSLGPLRNL